MHITDSLTNASEASYRRLVFIICWMTGIFAGINATIFSIMLPQAISEVAVKVTVAEMSQYGSYIIASFLGGWMFGGIFLGLLSDKFGRVKAMAFSIVLYSVFTALAGASQTVWQLAFFRFMTGIGVGGAMLGSSIFLSETWPARSRAIAVGALVSSYQVGVLLSAVIAQIFPMWRVAFAMGLIALVLAGIVFYYFRELGYSQKVREAMTTTKGQYRKNLMFGSFIFGCLLVGYWATSAWVPTWMHSLMGEKAVGHEKNLATCLHGLCAVVGCMVSGKLVDSGGRKMAIMLSFGGAFILSIWMFLQTGFSRDIYVLYSVLGFFIGMAQAVMYIYLPELFPTKVRATFVGICLNSGRLVTIVAVLFMGFLIPLLGGHAVALCLFSMTYLVGAIAAIYAPETVSPKA
ncbi:MAG: MFS transporter [Parachlamydiaceae bacterium]|nr:MFS transporter [Parachlamydiaceae bacterium]